MSVRIIIAEDETLIRKDLKEELTKIGYLVVGDVGDGQSAVNLARELKPDLVIMDINMPEMDGITASEILMHEHVAPVLLLTAYNNAELIERAKKAGVLHYLVKPWPAGALKPAIEVALARFAEYQDLEERVTTLEDKLATRKVVERAKGVLMEKHGISEQEAYARIQRASMNARKSMREVAEAILLTEEL
jgi:two-component system, response regulator PdtaR